MKAHVDTNPLTQQVRIWLYTRGMSAAGETHYLAPDLDTFVPQPTEAAPPEPTLTLNIHAAEALASALATMGRPEEATQRHLADAIKVRDRLLALVERS